MAITGEADTWLREEGKYENHCFVSWPHTNNFEIADCARRVKIAIESGLGATFAQPRVFLDESGIQGGDDWKRKLRSMLCGSMSMVAICAPIYFRTEHHWCGLEWASMAKLGDCRLPNVTYTTIIPLMVRKSEPLPWTENKIQYIDVSRVTLMGPRYFSTKEFRNKVNGVVDRIETIAEELWQGKVRADCDLFQFPTQSAFARYSAPAQPFPIVS
jgi:hypothetical protein